MIPRGRPVASVGLCLWAVAVAAGCSPTVEFGTVAVKLWQVPGPGNAPFLDDADEVLVDVTVDGVRTTQGLTEGRIEALEAAAEGSVVQLTVRALGPFGEAVGRTASFHVQQDTGALSVPAIMAIPGLTSLDDAAADDRTNAALCADGEGRALMAGGESGGALAFGSYLTDPERETIVEGPGVLARRTAAACTLLEDKAWLLGGCDLDRTGEPRLESASLASGEPFTEQGDPPPAETTCGAALAPTGEGFALLAGDVVERRDAQGALVVRHTLSEAHHHGQLVVDDRGQAIVAGGFQASDRLAASLGGEVFTAEGGSVEVAELGGETLLALFAGEAYAYTGGRIHAVGPGGALSEVLPAAVVDLPVGFVPAQMMASAAEKFLIVDEGGTEVVVLSPAGTTRLPLAPPRPGTRLAPGPGGAAFLLGGGLGAWIVVAP